jgi:hypothetical protein
MKGRDLIEWVATMNEIDAEGVAKTTEIAYHKCNETDFKRFFPIAKAQT